MASGNGSLLNASSFSSPFAAESSSSGSPQQQESAAFHLNERGEIARPEMLPSDWIELVLLGLLLCLGLPLNAMALSKQMGGTSSLLNPRKTSRISRLQQEVTRTNFLWLKLHLTVVDLLVILCYCPSHIAWLIGYTWSAGELLCKMMQYSWDFCFHLMSFGVVSIALDRLRTVYGLMRMERTGRMGRPSRQIRYVKRLILLSYLGAALVSLPQLFVWTTVDFSNWSQCTTVWHKARALEYLEGREFTESFTGERLYTLVHLLTVFWLPFAAILAAYAYIVAFLFLYSLRPCSAVPCSSSASSTLVLSQQNSNNICPAPAENGLSPGHLLTSECVSLWPSLAAPSSSLLPSSLSSQPCAGKPPPAVASRRHNVPAWRLEMRSRIFHTTIHVIAAYLVCWLPYNVLALATFFSKDLQITISVHLELLRICVLLNTLLNPFIYGFKKGGGHQ